MKSVLVKATIPGSYYKTIQLAFVQNLAQAGTLTLILRPWHWPRYSGLGLEGPGLGLGLGLETPGLGLGLGLDVLALTTSLI